MIALIDYDAGNIRSVEKALKKLGQEVCITRDRETLLSADRVILPGVGAFGDAMQHLEEYGLVEVIHEIIGKKTPFLGICMGLQLLFDESDEAPGGERSGRTEGKDPPDPGRRGSEDPPYGLEFPVTSKRRQAV